MSDYETWINEFTKSRREIAIRKLRVNVKSLAEEARIIRREVEKARSSLVKCELQCHRTGRLRGEARITQLALAAVRGKTPYSLIERNPKEAPNWKAVEEKVKRHCVGVVVHEALKWIADSQPKPKAVSRLRKTLAWIK